MAAKSELEIIRRAYAKQVMAEFGVDDPRLEKAFATIPRENFLGPGPWQIVRRGRGYVTTPSRDPVYVYDDVVVGILPEHNLNNGQPSLHAALIARAAPQTGERVAHIGIGLGYYTAILAQLVGRRGQVTAIEYDAELAARSTRNLAGLSQVTVVNGDGTQIDFPPADVIYVNAGATHPAPIWLDRLSVAGRLILPLTDAGFPNGNSRRGAVFLIERRGDDYLARRISGVAIFPCAGARDADGEAALAAAFARGGTENVTRLYRREDVPEADCWLRGKGWCLAYR